MPLGNRWRIGLVAALALLGAGCFARGTYTPILRYAVEPAVEVARAPATDQTLGVHLLEALRPYKQKIVYRDDPLVLHYYATGEWAEDPREVVTRTLIDGLAATGHFRDVGYAADLLDPDLILTGQVRRFDELRTESPWVAACELHLEVREVRADKLVWEGTLTAREPLQGEDLPALAEAMSRAVAQVVQEAAAAIAGS